MAFKGNQTFSMCGGTGLRLTEIFIETTRVSWLSGFPVWSKPHLSKGFELSACAFTSLPCRPDCKFQPSASLFSVARK